MLNKIIQLLKNNESTLFQGHQESDNVYGIGDDSYTKIGKEILELITQPKPNERYPSLRKIDLTIIAHGDEAQMIARNMENSFIAQEGLYTLTCGSIDTITDEELELFIDELPEELLDED